MIHIETQIKKYLIKDFERKNWMDFVDNQKMGDCQLVVASIKHQFPKVTAVFGEIKNDKGRWMTHHWIEYKGSIYEFNKGALNGHIDFMDLYGTFPESEYKKVRIK